MRHQELIIQALSALEELRQDQTRWNALNTLLLAFSESDLEDAIANLRQAAEYLEIDPKLRNVNPSNLPYNSMPGQLQRDLDTFYLELALRKA